MQSCSYHLLDKNSTTSFTMNSRNEAPQRRVTVLHEYDNAWEVDTENEVHWFRSDFPIAYYKPLRSYFPNIEITKASESVKIDSDRYNIIDREFRAYYF